MLSLAAAPLGFEMAVLTPQKTDPAAQVCSHVHLASLNDEAEIRHFLNAVDAVTFESEFVDTQLLSRCVPANVRVFPSLPVIGEIQDRESQKRLLDRYKIPTSPWLPVNSVSDLKRAALSFPKGLVLKQRRFGYDGYGTFVIPEPLKKLDLEVLHKSTSGFIAEQLIDFKRELAVSFVRSTSSFLSLPVVETVSGSRAAFQ